MGKAIVRGVIMSVLDDLIPKEKREHIYTREDFPTIFRDEDEELREKWDGLIDGINSLDDNDDRKQKLVAVMFWREMSLHQLMLEREFVVEANKMCEAERQNNVNPLDVIMRALIIGIIGGIALIIFALIKGAL